MVEKESTPAAAPKADITQQATTPTPDTRPAKDPKRVAAGKAVPERAWLARKVQKMATAETAVIIINKVEKVAAATKAPAPAPSTKDASQEKSILSTTQCLASIVVSLIGLYYKHKELKAKFSKITAAAAPAPAPMPPPSPAPQKEGIRRMD